jgi:hypothetical protein
MESRLRFRYKDIIICQSDFMSRQYSAVDNPPSFEVWICRHSILESSFSAFSSWDMRQDVLDVVTSDCSEKFSSKAFSWGMREYVKQMRYVIGASFFWNLGSWVNLPVSRHFLIHISCSLDTSRLFWMEFKQRLPTTDLIGKDGT